MSDTVFDFDKQLAIGDAGEEFLRQQHPSLCLAPEDERKYDLYCSDYHTTIELKTDTYRHDKTPNFFMERETRSSGVAKDGGPWRALADGVDYFVYMFVKPTPVAYWWCELKALVDWLDDWIAVKRRYVHRIRNKGWEARGFLVPRKEVPGYREIRYDNRSH